jgi:hypothetical protein
MTGHKLAGLDEAPAQQPGDDRLGHHARSDDGDAAAIERRRRSILSSGHASG